MTRVNEHDSSRLQFPVVYQPVIKQLEDEHGWVIRPLEMLTGGFSGAHIYHVTASDVSSKRIVGHYVAKLFCSESSQHTEQAHHTEAITALPNQFRQQHVLSLEASCFDSSSGTAVLIYPIAGDSLSEVIPIGALADIDAVTTAMTSVALALLNEWTTSVANAVYMHPYDVICAWSGDKATNSESPLRLFLSRDCHFDYKVDGLMIGEESFPNPLYYLNDKNHWPTVRELAIPISFSHGDLNVNNALLRYNASAKEIDEFYLIDFAYFRPQVPVLYDLLFLELSYLLSRASRLSGIFTEQLAPAFGVLASRGTKHNKLGPEYLGWSEVLKSMHRTVERWIQTLRPGLSDDMWALYHLAGTATGLAIANLASPAQEVRFWSYMWAAGHLNSLWELLSLSRPNRTNRFSLDSSSVMSYWEPFAAAVHLFDSSHRYVGIFGPQKPLASQDLSTLGRVPWSLILDFDPMSEVEGLHAQTSTQFEQEKRRIQKILRDDQVHFGADTVTYWHYARGLQDQPDSLVNSVKDWRRSYGEFIQEMLRQFSDSSFYPVTVVVFWDDIAFLRPLLQMVEFGLQSHFEIVLVPGYEDDGIRLVADEYEAQVTPISLLAVAQALSRYLRATPSLVTGSYLLPHREGHQIAIPAEKIVWLEEELEIVHAEVAVNMQQVDDRDAFYRGSTIAWHDLRKGRAVERAKLVTLMGNLERDLESRQTTRHNLYHAPGAGGTTMARQTAWKLRQKYPTVILHRISDIKETIARLQYLYAHTQKALLLIVEASAIDDVTLENLFRDIQNSRTPLTQLTVARRFERVAEGDRRVFLDEILDEGEMDQFVEKYSLLRPERRKALEQLKTEEPTYHVPFLVALTAYDRNFVRIQQYVDQRLHDATSIAREILQMIALIHYYSARTVDVNLFSALLPMVGDLGRRLPTILSTQQMQLLVRENGEWRPTHYLIGEQILQYWLVEPGQEQHIWKQKLKSLALRFIDLLDVAGNHEGRGSEPINDVLQALFVDRSWSSLVPAYVEGGEAYRRPRMSKLVTDIPTDEAKREVLEHLCEKFTEEGHFWAHLGRLLYGSRVPDFRRAIEVCETAVSKDPKDPLLHHMLGMARKALCDNQLGRIVSELRGGYEPTEQEVEDIHTAVVKSLECFDTTLELQPSSEHALVTGIQLLAHAINFGRSVNADDLPFAQFFAMPEAAPYCEYLNKAEDYLYALRQLYAGRPTSAFLSQSNGLLKPFYGNHRGAITDLKLLLQKPEIYHPRVRSNIVYTYLDEVNRRWDDLEPKVLRDILDLMDANLEQEPRSDSNIRNWFNAARRLPLTSIGEALEKLSVWFAAGESLDAAYYLYILNVLRVLDDDPTARKEADYYIERCLELGRRYRRPRTDYSLDMLAKNLGMARILNHEEIDWAAKAGVPTAKAPHSLLRISGRVRFYDGPQSGRVEFRGLRAFFTPGVSVQGEDPITSADLGTEISFFLGFTYEGPRAYVWQRIKR